MGTLLNKIFLVCSCCIISMLSFSEVHAQYRPELFFSEDWSETPPGIPITQEHVENKDLRMSLYGPGAEQLKKSHHDQPVDDPFYVWSGRCDGNWAVTLKHTQSNVDLSEHSKIVWRSKQSGFRCLHLILKLADGTWVASDQCDETSADWRVNQFNIADLNWYSLNIKTVVEGDPVENPDLSNVEEIGFTDLMRGGGSDASSRLDWIEVYGDRVEQNDN